MDDLFLKGDSNTNNQEINSSNKEDKDEINQIKQEEQNDLNDINMVDDINEFNINLIGDLDENEEKNNSKDINAINEGNELKIEKEKVNETEKKEENKTLLEETNYKEDDDDDDNFNLFSPNEDEGEIEINSNKINNEELKEEDKNVYIVKNEQINEDKNENIEELNNNDKNQKVEVDKEDEKEFKNDLNEKNELLINEIHEEIENINEIKNEEEKKIINDNEKENIKEIKNVDEKINDNEIENINEIENLDENKKINDNEKEYINEIKNVDEKINDNNEKDNLNEVEGVKEKEKTSNNEINNQNQNLIDINKIDIEKEEKDKNKKELQEKNTNNNNKSKEILNEKENKNKEEKDNNNKIEENEIKNKLSSNINIINENKIEKEYNKIANYYKNDFEQKDIERLIQFNKSNYKIFYSEKHFCDYNSGKEWRAGFIVNIEDDYASIIDATNKNDNDDTFKKLEINLNDSQNISYFRKFSKPDKYMAKGSSKNLKSKLEEFTKFHKNFKIYIKNCDDYQFYYFLRVSVYYGLDFCMNPNINNNNDNIQISFRLILIILDIIVDCLKYIEENLADFIEYQNNIKSTDLNDLVLINKKYAIFSFFDDIHFLIKKIFGDSIQYLDWYIQYKNVINQFNPAAINNLDKNKSLIPIYNDESIGKNDIKDANKSIQKICFPSIYYNTNHIFHTLDKEISSCIIGYFTDYFSFIGGFESLFRLIYSINNSKEQNANIIFNIQKLLLNDLYEVRAITDTFYNSHQEEKKKLQNYSINYLDNFDEKSFQKINKNEISTFFNKILDLTEKDKERKEILKENIHINFIFKEMQFSIKLEKKISFLSELNNIIKNIENRNSENKINEKENSQLNSESVKNKILEEDKIEVKKMTAEYFCQICNEKNVINLFFGDNTIHEEIIKRILPLLKIMHSNNYGYSDKEKEKIDKIKINLITIIIKKLKESEKNNESLFKIIQEIILDFAGILSPEDKHFVFLELKKYLTESINNKSSKIIQIFTLLINYSIKCINTSKSNSITEKKINEIDYESIMKIDFNEKEFYFLETLISFLLDKNKIKELNFDKVQKVNIINICIEGIINLLKKYNFNNIILKIIFTKIITGISSSINTIPNIELLEQIINLNQSNHKFREEIKNLCEKTDVFKSIINKFYLYLSETESLISAKESNKEIINENIDDDELYDFKTNIEKRLNFLFLLLNKENNIQISFEDFQNLFKILKTNNTITKQIFYSSIKNNIINLNYEFKNNIFEKIILNEEVFKINDIMSYQLMKEFVLEMNKSSNNFQFIFNKDLIVMTTNYGDDIYGYKILWETLTKTDNKEIQNDLTSFLRDIILGVRFEQMNSYKEFWNKTIEKMINILKKSENNNAIKGIIILIKKIIDESINDGEIIQDRKLIKKLISDLDINNEIKGDLNENDYFSATLVYYNNLDNNKNSVDKAPKKINGKIFFYHLRYYISCVYQIPLKCIEIEIPSEKERKEINLFSDYYKLSLSYLKYKENLMNNTQKEAEPFSFVIKKIKNPLNDDNNMKNIKALINSNTELFMILMKLLKNKNVNYTGDIWEIIKDKNNLDKNKNEIFNKFTKLINNKNDNDELLKEICNFEETNMIYQNFILSNLCLFLSDGKAGQKEKIEKFLESEIWNKIKNWLNEYKKIKIDYKNITINELLEEKKYIYNILVLYKMIIDNIPISEQNIYFFINQIINIIFELIKDFIDIDLNSLSDENLENKDNNIYEIKNIYLNILNLIIEIFETHENIAINFFKQLITESEMIINEDEFIGKIKFIFIEGILRNNYPFLNEKISKLLFSLIKNKCFRDYSFNENDNNKNISLQKESFTFIASIFFSGETNERIINILKDLFNNKDKDDKINIYEYNLKLYYKTTGEILSILYKLTYNKYNYEKYIIDYVTPSIYDPLIKDIKKESIVHDLYFGGMCEILLNYIQVMNINTNINQEYYSLIFNYKDKSIKDYLFNEVIMYKCDKDIIIPNKRIKITISQNQASHLFISILIKEIKEEDPALFFGNDMLYYLNRLDYFNKLGFWRGDQFSDWNLNYSEESNNANITSFIGLKNFGCTCYMNSLLQVFFHIIPFRESLLKCPCNEEKHNSLYEIRKLFNSLKYLRDNYYYTPESFVDNFDNEKINRHQQMDVDEFFTNILDKLENRLKNTENENTIKYFFEGSLNDTLTFQEGCIHNRTKENSFYSIQLQVQNKKNIYESLDAFTEGELMNGDNCIFCEHCNKKFPAIKSQSFNKLPRILMFVLKRFEFNYDKMKKIKINDYYEFPLELDMNKYTYEYINNKDDKINNKYILKSVVVHQGHSEGGHYYVFIKDNLSQTWYKFNDTNVSQFDINELANETFGGKEENMGINKTKSAYLLFYEKIDETNCKSFNKIKAINILNNKIEENENNDLNLKDNKDNKNKKDNKENKENNDKNEINVDEEAEEMLKNVNQESVINFLNKKLFSNEYHLFTLELFINILNSIDYGDNNLPLSFEDLYIEKKDYIFQSQLNNIFRKNRPKGSNINKYINKGNIKLFYDNTKNNNHYSEEEKEGKITELFKYVLIEFFNVVIRSKDKKYFACYVDLIKFLISKYEYCANYLLEEFSCYNVIVEYLINCPKYEMKKVIVGIIFCAMKNSYNEYIKNPEKMKEKQEKAIIKIKKQDNLDKQNNISNNILSGSKYAQINKNDEIINNFNLQNNVGQNNYFLQRQEDKVETFTKEKNDKKSNKVEGIYKEITKYTKMGLNLFSKNKKKEKSDLAKEKAKKNKSEEEEFYVKSENDFEIIERKKEIEVEDENEIEESNVKYLRNKNMSPNVLKLVYNIVYTMTKIKFKYNNELRFLYDVLLKFCLVSQKAKEFLTDTIKMKLKLNYLMFLNEEEFIRTLRQLRYNIDFDIDKGLFNTGHEILNSNPNGDIFGEQDKNGKYFRLKYGYNLLCILSFSKEKSKEELEKNQEDLFFSFHNKKYIQKLIVLALTKQDINYLSKLFVKKCFENKIIFNNIVEVLIFILRNMRDSQSSFYDKIEEENNDDIYNNSTNNKLFFKRIKANIIIIFRNIIFEIRDTNFEYRFKHSIEELMSLFREYKKYYGVTIAIINIIIDIFSNAGELSEKNQKPLQEILDWLYKYPVPPKLYEIKGLMMYKPENESHFFYYQGEPDKKEKEEFDKNENKKTKRKIEIISKILEGKKIEKNISNYNSDLSDFQFAIGDEVIYDKKDYVITNFIDEYIKIKIIDNNEDNKNKKQFKVKGFHEKPVNISEKEKKSLWVETDKYNLRIKKLISD